MVLKATVVENHIHHDLQTLGMGLVAEMFVVVVRAKTGIHLVIIGCGITMISGEAVLCIRRVVLQDWGEPEGCHTKLLEVVEVFADAVEVTAMTE